MGVYIWNRLPSEYQEVEYIQSSGTQYINTGYVPGSNTEVEMKFKLMNRNTSVGIYLYGCRNGASGADRRSFNLELYNNKLAAHAYSNTGSYERIAYTINDISLDTLYTLKQNDYGLYLDGTLQGTFASHNSYTVQGYNMALFCGNVAGTWGSFTSLKVYSMTIKDSGTLVRYMIPCYRKSDNVIGLYDLVNNQFYTNSGSGTFSKGSDVNTYRESSLKNAYIGEYDTPPSEYQKVEYIQSSGTQWINTGYNPDNNTNVECKVNMQPGATYQFPRVYGVRNGLSGSSERDFSLQWNRDDKKFGAVNYSNTTSAYQITSGTLENNTDYTIKHTNTQLRVNGVSQGTVSATTYSISYPLWLFNDEQAGSDFDRKAKMKLYRFKMYNGTTLVRDFIPCYRKSDNVIGMYDLVNDVFYTNAGTGTFTKGPDVN